MHWTDPLFWQKIFTASICGAFIGVERQLRGKPAGIRTCILICTGAMIFTSLGGLSTEGKGDPSRVIGQIVTGVGFLGAGVILNRQGQVVGMTSAASIWVLASIGVAIGMGYLVEALILAGLTWTILVVLNKIESKLPILQRGAHRHVPAEQENTTIEQ